MKIRDSNYIENFGIESLDKCTVFKFANYKLGYGKQRNKRYKFGSYFKDILQCKILPALKMIDTTDRKVTIGFSKGTFLFETSQVV
jgi:hypothetical protein